MPRPEPNRQMPITKTFRDVWAGMAGALHLERARHPYASAYCHLYSDSYHGSAYSNGYNSATYSYACTCRHGYDSAIANTDKRPSAHSFRPLSLSFGRPAYRPL